MTDAGGRDVEFGKENAGYFEFKTPLGNDKGTELTIKMVHKFGTKHTLGKFRISVTTTKPPLSLKPLPEPIAKLLPIEADQRTPEQKAQLAQFYAAQDQELARLRQAVAEHGTVNDPRLPGAQDLALSARKPRFIEAWGRPGRAVDVSRAAVLWCRPAFTVRTTTPVSRTPRASGGTPPLRRPTPTEPSRSRRTRP